MTRLAFYAPLKSPRHDVPSGDREMANGLLAALALNPMGFEVDLVSELRCYDGKGDALVQEQLLAQAKQEIDRLLQCAQQQQWCAWVTYHNYYKAPDLLGPAICSSLKIPYLIIEASIASRRRQGPWADFAARSDAACHQADVILYLTQRDKPALQHASPSGQALAWLPPFLNLEKVNLADLTLSKENQLLAVGMHRFGDKLESYKILAETIDCLTTTDWQLCIVGDGAAHAEVRALFEPFGERVRFTGQLDREALDIEYRRSKVFVWPGVNEAFGMVYLEAQAAGVAALAQDRPGVREVLGSPDSLVPVGDASLLAQAIDRLLTSNELRLEVARTGQIFVRDQHLLDSAAHRLSEHIRPLVQ